MKRNTVLLMSAAMGAQCAMASITTTYSNLGNMSASVGALTNALTVAAGDVVVMVGATNKKKSVNKLTFTSSAGTFVDLDTATQLANDANPNSYLSYLVIDTAGTYDFIGTTDVLGMTATVGAYKLSADSGLIELAAYNAKSYNMAVGESRSITNFMGWGSNANAGDYDGIATIGVGSSLRGTISNTDSVGGFFLDIDKSGKRLAGYSDRSGEVNVKHIWDITNADAANAESGGFPARPSPR